jgi:hypothetical protein
MNRIVLAVTGVAFVLLAPPRVLGQGTASQSNGPAADYMTRYHEILNIQPQAGQVAEVHHLVLTRDVGRLTLEQGQLYLLSPIGGRVVGAVFRGEGRFAFAPTVPAERAELERFASTPTIDDTIQEAIMLFSDSTAAELRGLAFGPGLIPGDVGDHVRDLLGSFKGHNDGSYGSDVLSPLLNCDTSLFFLARVEPVHGEALLFEIDPSVSEAVQLYHPVGRLRWGGSWAVITESPLQHPLAGTGGSWRFRERATVPSYQIEVHLRSTGGADLDFAARALLTIKATEPVGPWLRFILHSKLLVDSARWSDGAAATAFKAKDEEDLWIRAPRRLSVGDSLALTLFYHGNLIDRYLNWFYIDPTAAWYPINAQGPNNATFDLTYHSPNWYPIASVGDRTDSTVSGKELSTHWVTRFATPFATFNLGLFENYHVQQEGVPPLDVLLSEDAHRELSRQLAQQGVMLPQQSHMRENVAADVTNSLKLYAHLFGDSPYGHFYVTEIPYGEGVSFPGMIDLSWSTFQNTSLDGFDEFFRAHEVAHQWWGNGVQPISYRDAWLSEGLATFSALWYLQSERKHNDEYFKFLDQYRTDIRDDRDDAGPIWIGYRNATPNARRGYDVMIYEKGAWVFHMLRILMLDLSTMKEDRFTETLRDFYQTYRGHQVTTSDFQQVVERHAGIPMDWFFDEWVKGTAIPTYHVAWTSQPAADGKYTVRLRVTQEHVPPGFQMFVLVSADLGNNRFAHFRVPVHDGQTEYTSPLLPAQPRGLRFNELNSVLADVKMEGW